MNGLFVHHSEYGGNIFFADLGQLSLSSVFSLVLIDLPLGNSRPQWVTINHTPSLWYPERCCTTHGEKILRHTHAQAGSQQLVISSLVSFLRNVNISTPDVVKERARYVHPNVKLPVSVFRYPVM